MGVVTSCRSSKMATTASQIYFRFQFWWRISLKNVQFYSHTKFRQDSSIRGWDITISGLWKQRAAILKFDFGFYFDVSVVIDMWFSVGIPNFIQIGPSAAELCRHNHFRDGGHSIANLLSVSAWWRIAIKNVKIYLHTKFRHRSLFSIRGRDITISCLWKTNVRHIEILLPFWRFRRHRRLILPRRARFHRNRTISGRVMTS